MMLGGAIRPATVFEIAGLCPCVQVALLLSVFIFLIEY